MSRLGVASAWIRALPILCLVPGALGVSLACGPPETPEPPGASKPIPRGRRIALDDVQSSGETPTPDGQPLMSLSCSHCERSIDVVGTAHLLLPLLRPADPGVDAPEPAVNHDRAGHRQDGRLPQVRLDRGLRGDADLRQGSARLRRGIPADPQAGAGGGWARSTRPRSWRSRPPGRARADGSPVTTHRSRAARRFLQGGAARTQPRSPPPVRVRSRRGHGPTAGRFIVMELMPGHTLKDLVEPARGPLPQKARR